LGSSACTEEGEEELMRFMITAIVEPHFLGLGAAIQIHPVMIPEELGLATPAIEQPSEKYG
jgi:hypothetical protein